MPGKRILLIDDDLDDQMLFCEALRIIYPDGVCDLASTAHDALTMIPTVPPYDLIFLDLYLPKVDGFELLTLLKDLDGYKNVPIHAITTSSSLREGERLKNLGIESVIFKPSSFNELIDVLTRVLQ